MRYTIFNTPLIKTFLWALSIILLKTFGWKTIGHLPASPKYLIIVAPHTSNWDLFYGIMLAFSLKLDAHFLAKKELFRWPFGPVIKWLGGIAIDRSSTANAVDRMITKFKKNKNFVLALAPEGTRYKVRYWKSGFYHIAVGAGVPIQIGFIDYASKTGGAGPLIHPSGDITGDMEIIRDFYMKIKGKHSEQTAPASIYTKS